MSDVWPSGVDRVLLDEVDSTMAEAARRAPDLNCPTWIMARNQIAARGRRGRDWENPKGNFAATLICFPDAAPAEAALRAFTASNALYEALAQVLPENALSLKWPNDVLLYGGKVAGILLESAGVGDRVQWLSIGIGVNLAETPGDVTDAAFQPTSLGEHGVTLGPEDLLQSLAIRMAEGENHLQTQGFTPVRDIWLTRAARLGQRITARTGTAEITGVFDTIDAQGQLVLRTAKGQVQIPAGDVFF